MFKKFTLFLLPFVLTITAYYSILANNPDSKAVSKYVDNVVQKSLSLLKDNSKTMDQKIEECEQSISENMDTMWMAKFVLGKYRKTLSTEQFDRFQKLYSTFVVQSYGNAVRYYKPDQTVTIQSETPISDNEFAVKTLLISPGAAEPLKIDYIIRSFDDGSFKVFDIVTEGISLINSNQAEFSSIISNSGYDELMKDLQSKIQSLSNKNGNRQTEQTPRTK